MTRIDWLMLGMAVGLAVLGGIIGATVALRSRAEQQHYCTVFTLDEHDTPTMKAHISWKRSVSLRLASSAATQMVVCQVQEDK